jgi:hypothetical protein
MLTNKESKALYNLHILSKFVFSATKLCPSAAGVPMDAIRERIARGLLRCPFMHSVKEQSGEEAAVRTAAVALKNVHGVAPLDPAAQEAFQMAHGPGGIIPIISQKASVRSCPFSAKRSSQKGHDAATGVEGLAGRHQPAAATEVTIDQWGSQDIESFRAPSGAFASISLAGFWVWPVSLAPHTLLRPARPGRIRR